MKVLETDRLNLRRISIDDAEFILQLLNEPSFLQFIGDRGVRTFEDARNYILNGPMASYERFGFGLYLTELKEPRVPIGMCGLLKRDTLEDVDIGFAFVPQYWKQGYAMESAAAVMAHAKNAFGLNRLAAITSPENEPSIALLLKLGMRFEKLTKLAEEAPEIKLFICDL
jgi:RimJ/RimL family protein N-acetyltransferase